MELESIENPYAYNLAINNSCEMESNVFDKSFNNIPVT